MKELGWTHWRKKIPRAEMKRMENAMSCRKRKREREILCVCVFERDREREREKAKEWESERKKEKERERERERGGGRREIDRKTRQNNFRGKQSWSHSSPFLLQFTFPFNIPKFKIFLWRKGVSHSSLLPLPPVFSWSYSITSRGFQFKMLQVKWSGVNRSWGSGQTGQPGQHRESSELYFLTLLFLWTNKKPLNERETLRYTIA